MKSRKNSILLLACLLFSGQFVSVAQGRHDVIKTVEKYYDGLNDFAKYDRLDKGNIIILFAKSGNKVHNDLRQFQGQGVNDIVTDSRSDVAAYLNTINTLVRNTGKTLTIGYKINKGSYREEWVRNAQTSDLERRAYITVIKEITYGTEYSNQQITIQDDITLVNGLIAQIESKEYTPPFKSFAQKAFEVPDDEMGFYGWGTTDLAFGLTLTGTFEGLILGFGAELGPWKRGGREIFEEALLLQAAYSFRYFGFGTLLGIGIQTDRGPSTEYVHGEPVDREQGYRFASYLSPYVDIRIPLKKKYYYKDPAALHFVVGYNIYLFNGSDLNGLRFGLGYSI